MVRSRSLTVKDKPPAGVQRPPAPVALYSRLLPAAWGNQALLIDHGQPAPTLGCVSCWGATLNGVVDPARSALGITADGRLIWGGSEHPTLASLADALLAAHVVRAVELDINPEWVAAYLYRHAPDARPSPVPMVAGQQRIPGEFLSPWSRDFFTVVTR